MDGTEVEKLVVTFTGDLRELQANEAHAESVIQDFIAANKMLEETISDMQSEIDDLKDKIEKLDDVVDDTSKTTSSTSKTIRGFGDALSMVPGPAGRISTMMRGAVASVSAFYAAAGPLIPIVLAVAAAIAAVVGPVILMNKVVGVSIEKMAELDPVIKQATAVGESVSNIQSLTFALGELAGMSGEQVSTSLRQLTIVTGQAMQTGGEAAAVFDSLGVNLQDMAKATPAEQFRILADAIKGVESRTERAAIAAKLFGESGVAMLPALESQADALKEAEDAARSFGLTLTQTQAKGIENANDAVGRLKSVFEGWTTQIAAELAPVIEAVAEILTDLLPKAGELGPLLRIAVDAGVLLLGILTDMANVIKGSVQLMMGDFAAGLEAISSGLSGEATTKLKEEVAARRQANEEQKNQVTTAKAVVDEQAKINAAAQTYVDRLKEQSDYMDYVQAGGEASLEVFRMIQQNADAGLVQAAQEFEAKIRAIEEKQARSARGQAITEQYQTPLESAIKQAEELQDLLAGGDITRTTFDRAIEQMNEGLNEANEQAREFYDRLAPLGEQYVEGIEGFRSELVGMRAEGIQATGRNVSIEDATAQARDEARRQPEMEQKLVNVLELLAQRLGQSSDPNATSLETTNQVL